MRGNLVSDKNDVFEFNSQTFDERLMDLENQKALAKKERNSPFSRWTQFNNDHTKELMWLAINYPKAHAILYFLVDQMDEYNAVMVSYKVIQEVMGIGRTTASQSIKILKNNGYIAVLKSGTSNVYAINDNVYWKSWGNNRRYSKFPATVVLALSEQEESYQLSIDDLQAKKHKEVTKK